MRVALKFAYDGTKFFGYQRQPQLRTVEGDVLRAMMKLGIIKSVRGSRYQAASRTDRGVSALGNVLAIDTTFPLESLRGALNSSIRDAWFWGLAETSDDFSPRRARMRWYRYHLTSEVSLSRLKEAATLFQGDHDFGQFSHEKVSQIRAVDSIQVSRDDVFTVIDLRAKSFLWQMARRIVASLLAYERGDTELARIEETLRGAACDFGLVPPEPLFLVDVDYGFDFNAGLRPRIRARLNEEASDLRIKERFLSSLLSLTA